MFTSTRKLLNKNEFECITKGLSDDGGLFICNNFKNFKVKENFKEYDYNELSFEILSFFFKNFSELELKNIINNAYNKFNFVDKVVNTKILNDNISFLELYHGPTMAFKDMALTILPHLMSESKKKLNNNKKTLILTATSGDTGGACLSGFRQVENTKIIVLYPTEGVSKFQESQMHYYTSDNAKAIAIKGNFDDCQNLVKKVFNNTKGLKNIELSSANSINIGRLVPQIIYYFYSYFDLVRKNKINYGEKINFVVPTGNFGNILACYIAKEMGLFVNKIVCASNENKVLTDFFNTLVYNKNRNFLQTNSPSMDILISSNLERLLYLITDCNYELVCKLMSDLKETGIFELPNKYKEKLDCFLSYSINKEETVEYITDCYNQYNYLIDPHTAVAYGTAINLIDELDGQTVVVSTASPYKFIETVNKVFNVDKEGYELVKQIKELSKVEYPELLNSIYNNKMNKIVWDKESMEENLIKMIGEIDESC